jgi:hypothetical protein
MRLIVDIFYLSAFLLAETAHPCDQTVDAFPSNEFRTRSGLLFGGCAGIFSNLTGRKCGLDTEREVGYRPASNCDPGAMATAGLSKPWPRVAIDERHSDTSDRSQ